MSGRIVTIAAALGITGLLGVAAGCGSDKAVTGATTTAAASTTAAPTTTAGGTVAPTSVAPTVAPTLAPTSEPPAAAGWAAVDPATIDAPLAFPCCASNWYGANPSPGLPAAGAPLADGAYRISFQWPTDPSQPITATVYRFEQCSLLPEGSCEDIGGPYPPDESGVDESTEYTLTFTLDSSIKVNLGGFTGGDGGWATGTGLDLAELLAALDADYQAAILDPIAGGASEEDVIAGLVASPAHGFAAPAEEFAGVIAYTYGDAPPLLFQALPGVDEGQGDRGTSVIGTISLLVSGGQMSLQLYAGFYS